MVHVPHIGAARRVRLLPTSEIEAGLLPDHLVSDPRGKQYDRDRERSDARPHSMTSQGVTTPVNREYQYHVMRGPTLSGAREPESISA
jgi:hypothetical protein